MFWLGLIIGLFIGTNLGILVMSWVCAGAEADRIKNYFQDKNWRENE
jgi:Na+/H+ antiporter NhaA